MLQALLAIVTGRDVRGQSRATLALVDAVFRKRRRRRLPSLLRRPHCLEPPWSASQWRARVHGAGVPAPGRSAELTGELRAEALFRLYRFNFLGG
jgi:hypothetical protein